MGTKSKEKKLKRTIQKLQRNKSKGRSEHVKDIYLRKSQEYFENIRKKKWGNG